MRRRALLAAMCAALTLCAVPAQAQGWRWLEKLSGPGDFTGYELNVKIFCHYEEATPDEALTKRFVFPVSLPCLIKAAKTNPDKTRKVVRDVSAPDDSQQGEQPPHPFIVQVRDGHVDLTRRIDAFGVGVSYLRGSGDLEYAPVSEHIDRTVQLWAFEGFYDRRWTDRVDYGIAAGVNIFVVPEADNFAATSIEPRITIKMFDLRKRNIYAGTASLRIGALILLKQFDAEDFGAIPGTYRSSRVDVGPSFRFVLDFDRNPFKSY
jgi:hypothetical protein